MHLVDKARDIVKHLTRHGAALPYPSTIIQLKMSIVLSLKKILV